MKAKITEWARGALRQRRPTDWTLTPEWVVLSTVLAIAALISYTHQRAVWLASGSAWADLGPLLVDGLFAAAWLRMRRRRREGTRVGWLAWLALLLAMLGTLAGNLTSPWVAGRHDLLPYVVAAVPAIVFLLVWELVTGHGSRVTARPVPTGPEQTDDTDEADEADDEPVATLRSDEEHLIMLREWAVEHRTLPSNRKIRELTRSGDGPGCGAGRAGRLLRMLEAEQDDESTGTGDQ